MVLAFAIAMLSKECYGPTAIYLTIITGVVASYVPSTELYAKHKVSQARDAAGKEKAGQSIDAENYFLPVITGIHGLYMPPPGRKKNPGL
ncbi:hypothetical protein OEZ85_009483 [Tetradesmus obliquus]|uniref:Uncharacterized protein n=1 Tax=Tetradesmus obliquus TaxID=3088 RepID=A0ABY8U9F3_TETOB|nr:hypothetical protein OEZ85_009483 [Tetradesmus obliquus]